MKKKESSVAAEYRLYDRWFVNNVVEIEKKKCNFSGHVAVTGGFFEVCLLFLYTAYTQKDTLHYANMSIFVPKA